jgi:putative serine protease PepD
MNRMITRATRVGVPLLAAGAVGAGIYAGVNGSSGASSPSVTAPAAKPIASTRAYLDPAQLYKQSVGGVVDLQVTSGAGGGGGGQGFPPFGGPRSSQAEGAGFVLDKSGDIVTNDHVVAGATAITVVFSDGSKAKGTLVGSDSGTDLAVVKVSVDASKLDPLPLADSGTVRPGDPVVAIGSPYGYENSISAGIVSGIGREIQSPDGTPIENAIQTDAALNHGNSGGPLLSTDGKVIGVNAQIASNNGEGTGVGFAIPSNTVKSITAQLMTGKAITRAYLGVVIANAAGGVKVSSVSSGSPAGTAGLKVGDVITSVDGKAVTSASGLRAVIGAHSPGDKVTLKVTRGGSDMTVEVTLGARPTSIS